METHGRREVMRWGGELCALGPGEGQKKRLVTRAESDLLNCGIRSQDLCTLRAGDAIES